MKKVYDRFADEYIDESEKSPYAPPERYTEITEEVLVENAARWFLTALKRLLDEETDRKTENSSEKPNNCEDFFREPTAEERKAVADYIDSISVPTGMNIFDLMDEPTVSKMEQVEDEPQTDRLVQTNVIELPDTHQKVVFEREITEEDDCIKIGEWKYKGFEEE